MMKIVRVMKLYEEEILEVQWVLKDKSIFVRRYTIPPAATRLHSEEKEETLASLE